MLSLLADLLGMLASWLGLGLLGMLIIGLKAWDILRAYRRSRARASTASTHERK